MGFPRDLFWVPVLFINYMLPLRKILLRHGLDFHCYIDDTELYEPLKPGTTDVSNTRRFSSEVLVNPFPV